MVSSNFRIQDFRWGSLMSVTCQGQFNLKPSRTARMSLWLLWIALSSYGVQGAWNDGPRDRFNPSATTLYVSFVSSHIPEAEKYSWMAELSLTSFLMSFQQPIQGVQLVLNVYMQCKETKIRDVAQLEETKVSDSLMGYVDATVRSISRFKGAFAKIEYFCSSLLGQAVCHTGKVIRNTAQNKRDYFFLLEHDWILLPSKLQQNLRSMFDLLDSSVSYITLQRGGRTQYEMLPGKLNLRRYGYTNNPYLSSISFLKRITSTKADLCSKASIRDWEYITSRYCTEHNCKTSLMGTPGSHPSIYHVDGRFLSYAANTSTGPLFQNLRTSMTRYMAQETAAQTIIREIDQTCTKYGYLCSPLYVRKKFMLHLFEFAMQNQMKNLGLIPTIAKFLNDSLLATQIAKGELPGRACLRQLSS